MRRFQCSFDHYATADGLMKWSAISNVGGIVAAQGRRGTAGWQRQPAVNYGYRQLTLPDKQATIIVGGAQKFTAGAWNGTKQLYILLEDAAIHCDLRIDALGRLQVTRNGTQLGLSTRNLDFNRWDYIEFKVYIHDTLGTFEARVNGENWVSGINQDTRNAGAVGAANQIQFYAHVDMPGYSDDLYINDGQGAANNTFSGDQKVVAFLATANGTNRQWSRSAGADDYSLIDEPTPNGDTDYLYSSTAGQKVTCAFGGLSLTGAIQAVQVLPCARKDDAGVRTICPVIRSAAADYDGASVNVGDAYAYIREVFENDPATAAAWTVGGFNAAEFGAKLVA
jgi:hypothetical protein